MPARAAPPRAHHNDRQPGRLVLPKKLRPTCGSVRLEDLQLHGRSNPGAVVARPDPGCADVPARSVPWPIRDCWSGSGASFRPALLTARVTARSGSGWVSPAHTPRGTPTGPIAGRISYEGHAITTEPSCARRLTQCGARFDDCLDPRGSNVGLYCRRPYSAGYVGVHAARPGTRFAALGPIRQSVRRHFGPFAKG